MIEVMFITLILLSPSATFQEEQDEPISMTTVVKLDMPEVLSGMKLVDTHEYEDSRLGFSFQYSGDAVERLDVYVYHMDVEEIPTGWENDKVKEHEKTNKLELETMVEKGYLDKVVWKSKSIYPKTGDIRFRRNTYEVGFEEEGEQRTFRSEMFLTGFVGKFVKVRASIDMKNVNDGVKATEKFVLNLSKYLERNLKSYKKEIAKDILSAIKEFRKDPESKNGAFAMAKIFSFTEESDYVNVIVSQDYCPWLGDDTCDKAHIITTAYFAGNIKPQLERGINKNHSYEGIMQVLETYKKLKKKKAIQTIDTIEQLNELKRKGQLRKYVRQFEKKDKDEKIKADTDSKEN